MREGSHLKAAGAQSVCLYRGLMSYEPLNVMDMSEDGQTLTGTESKDESKMVGLWWTPTLVKQAPKKQTREKLVWAIISPWVRL